MKIKELLKEIEKYMLATHHVWLTPEELFKFGIVDKIIYK